MSTPFTAKEANELMNVGQLDDCERIVGEILEMVRERALSGYDWVSVYGYGFSGPYKNALDLSQALLNVISRLRTLGYRCEFWITPRFSLFPFPSGLTVRWGSV